MSAFSSSACEATSGTTRLLRMPRSLFRRHETGSRHSITTHIFELSRQGARILRTSDEIAVRAIPFIGGGATEEEEGGFSELYDYLLSDDTRLPAVPLFSTSAAPPEDYDTYVGEDIWLQQRTSSSDDGFPLVPSASSPAVAMLCRWMLAALKDSPSHQVVLCGERRAATDCSWAVSSRSCTLSHPRDIMLAMRMSTGFLHDLAVQAEQRTEEGTGVVLRMFLEAAVEVPAASEFRLFVRPGTSDGEATARQTVQRQSCLVTQRSVDVCYPELSKWSREDAAACWSAIWQRVAEWKGLDNTTLLDYLHREFVKQMHSSRILWILLDLTFESPSLPVRVLGGACVAAETEQDNDHDVDIEEVESTAVYRLLRDRASLDETATHVAQAAASASTTDDFFLMVSDRVLFAKDAEDLMAAPVEERFAHLPIEAKYPSQYNLPSGDFAKLAEILKRVQQ